MQEKKNLDQILKLFFDKTQEKFVLGAKELESYIKSSVNPKEPNISLKSTIQTIKRQILDSTSPYRQLILKTNDFTILFAIFHVLKSFQNVPPNIYFILIEPLMSFFKEQEPKIIVSSAKALIKLIKNITKVVLTYFTNFFDSIIILKLNPDQDVRNSGNALDEFLKDSLGNSFQGIITSKKENECNFSIEYLLQKLRENSHPAVQILIVSWITFIEAIPDLKLVKYLTKIIPELLIMLNDKTKDVYQCAEQCLKKISIGIEAHYDELSDTYQESINEIAGIIIGNCKNPNDRVKSCAFEWLLMLLNKYSSIISSYIAEKENGNGESKNIHQKNKNLLLKVGLIEKAENKKMITSSILINKIPFDLFSKILEILIYNVGTTSNRQIENLFKKCNSTFQTIILTIPFDVYGDNIQQLEIVIKRNLDIGNQESAITLILDWTLKLFGRFNCKMFSSTEEFIEKLVMSIPEKNEAIFNGILDILCQIAIFKQSYSNEIIHNVIYKLSKNQKLITANGINILKKLSSAIPVCLTYEISSDNLLKNNDIIFVVQMINIMDIFLLVENETEKVRNKLKRTDDSNEENEKFFEKIFTLWSFNPISTLILCIISEKFELSYFLTLKLAEMKLNQEDYIQLTQMVQLIESSLFNGIRIKLLEPLKNILFVKTLYAILMLLPQGQAFNALANRLKSIEMVLKLDDNKEKIKENIEIEKEKKKMVEKYIRIFQERQKIKSTNSVYYT